MMRPKGTTAPPTVPAAGFTSAGEHSQAPAAPQDMLGKRVETWKRLLQSKRLDRLAWFFILLPVFLGFCYVYTFGVNVVWEDPWSAILPIFQNWHAGTLSFWDFWVQGNEHRHVLPRMVQFVLAVATRWNNLAEMYFNQAVFTAMLAGLVFVFRRECKSQHWPWLTVPVAFLVFSFRQNDNMLWGHQVVFVLAAGLVLASFFCLYLLSRPQRAEVKFAAATGLATLATFSAAHGLLVWPVGLLQLLVAPLGKRRRMVFASLWVTAACVEWLMYFWSFKKPAWHPDWGFSWQYFATIVGGSLVSLVVLAAIVGAVVLIIVGIAMIISLGGWKISRHSLWLAMILFGLLVELQTTVGRSGFGPGQALSSRYATFSLFIVIGAYAILSVSLVEKSSRLIAATWGALFSLVVVGLTLSAMEGYEVGIALRQAREYQAFVLCTSESQADRSLQTSPNQPAPVMREGIALVKELGWNVFAYPELAAKYAPPDAHLPVLPQPARVVLNQMGFNKEMGLIAVTGCALDARVNDVVGGVFLQVDGILYPTYYGVARDDVVQTVKTNKVRRCGFQRTFSVGQLGAGRHQLTVKVLTKDRQALFAPQPPVEFTVTE